MSPLKILVTGGAGFIGSHVAERLSEENEVHVLDDFSEGSLENLEGVNVTIHRGDITDFDLESIGPIDSIYHLACRKMVYSVEQPIRDLEVNALGTLKLLEYAREHGTSMLYTSTGSVYGNPELFPTPEWAPKNPESPYGVSKWMAEEYCTLYHKLYGLRVVIARLYSVYGPRQTEIGVIPKFIRQGLTGKPFTIMGKGLQRRPFTYVSDTVNGILLALDKGEPGETYNIAGSLHYSIITLCTVLHDILHIPLKGTFIERRTGDLDKVHPSTERIRKLGFKAEIELPEGLRRTLEWIKSGN